MFTGAIGIAGLCQGQSRIFEADVPRKDAIGQHEPSFNFGSFQAPAPSKKRGAILPVATIGTIGPKGNLPYARV